jgi:hypothetical protein
MQLFVFLCCFVFVIAFDCNTSPCTSKGLCTNKQCQCQKNVQGGNCEDCRVGFFGKQCMPCSCSFPFICSDGMLGDGSCHCPVGFKGNQCKECDVGYYGKDCKSSLVFIVECDCNFGECQSDGSCICTDGYSLNADGKSCKMAECMDDETKGKLFGLVALNIVNPAMIKGPCPSTLYLIISMFVWL